MHAINMFERSGPLTIDGFKGSGAALVDFRFLANTLLTTDEATSAARAVARSSE